MKVTVSEAAMFVSVREMLELRRRLEALRDRLRARNPDDVSSYRVCNELAETVAEMLTRESCAEATHVR